MHWGRRYGTCSHALVDTSHLFTSFALHFGTDDGKDKYYGKMRNTDSSNFASGEALQSEENSIHDSNGTITLAPAVESAEEGG